MRPFGFVLDLDSQPVTEVRRPNRDFTEPLLRGDTVLDRVFDDRLEKQCGHAGFAHALVDRGLNGEPFVPEARSAFRKLTGDLNPDALDSTVTYAQGDDADVTRERLRELTRAVERRKTSLSEKPLKNGETHESVEA